jgi:hypothetical protein
MAVMIVRMTMDSNAYVDPVQLQSQYRGRLLFKVILSTADIFEPALERLLGCYGSN